MGRVEDSRDQGSGGLNTSEWRDSPSPCLTMGQEGRSVLAGTDERQDTVTQEMKLAGRRCVL